MEDILSKLAQLDLIYIAISLLILLVAISFVLGIRYFLMSRVDVVGERMRRVAIRDFATPYPQPLRIGDRGDTALGKTFRAFGRIARPLDEESMGRLRSRLSHAGYRGERAVLNYLSVKMFAGLACVGLLLWYNSVRVQPLVNLPVYIVVFLIVGFYLPGVWVTNKVRNRQREINRGMPDALDLLVTCVESGLGLDAAVNRVADEVALSAPLLSQELLQASFEIQAGSTRGEAFRRMSDRTGVEEIRNLSALVVQTEKFGTSVAKTLRVMADGMRTRRMQQAEERAATASVKMTFPLIFCIFPTLFVVILGPAIIKIMKFFAEGPGR